MEPELTVRSAGESCGSTSADAYYGRTYAEGKKIRWRDGFRAVRVLGQVRMRRLAP